MKKKMQGFTLIELMVVVTIIGILAAIVIVNLSKTLGRGQDTSILDQMSEIRSQAVGYYQDNYGYTSSNTASSGYIGQTPCVTTADAVNTTFNGSLFADPDFVRSIAGIHKNSASIPSCYLGGYTAGAHAQSFAIVTKLRNAVNGNKYWCIDSTGQGVYLTADSPNAATSPEVSCQ